MSEPLLWERLKNMGFMERLRPITKREVFINKVLYKLGFKPRYFATTNPNWLVHSTRDGKIVDVYGLDIWYTQMSIDGEIVFDARRFNNQELIDLIPYNLVVSK